MFQEPQQQELVRLSAVKHAANSVTVTYVYSYIFRTSISKICEMVTLNSLLLLCHLYHVDNMCMPVSVDNIPEYKDPQARSASAHNKSFLPVAKHMPLSLFSGDL